jgi:ABC-type sugar transport system ATPase subunit
MQTEQTVLEARGLTKSFPGVRALSGVDFTARAGRVHALLGENGAGKSTLVGILTGNQRADAGTLTVSGQARDFGSPREALDAGVMAVYQELTVLPAMSVLDNVMLGQELTTGGTVSTARQREVARAALARVGLADIDLGTPAGDYSLANQQLIEIARALVRKSGVVILDEPSAVLSGDKLDALHAVVRELAAAGTAVVYITHLLDEVQALADDVTVLRDGATVAEGVTAEFDTERIVREMVGRTVDAVFPEPGELRGDVVLKLSGVVPRSRTRRPAPLDLEVRAGEIVGVAGLVGSGRSRLLRTIAGAHPLTAGRIEVAGRPIGGSIRRALRAGVVLVPEERKTEGLVLDLTVSENTTLAVLGRISRVGWIRRAAQRMRWSSQQARLGIRSSGPDQETRLLSGGNQQKVVIAKWLELGPKLLVLDEPTRGVDVGAKAEIYQIVTELAAQGLAVVVASSELIEVLGLSHRVLVAREGSIVGELPGGLGNEEEVMHLAMGTNR